LIVARILISGNFLIAFEYSRRWTIGWKLIKVLIVEERFEEFKKKTNRFCHETEVKTENVYYCLNIFYYHAG